MKKFLPAILLVLVVIATAVQPLHAQEKSEGGAAHSEKAEKPESWTDQVFPWVNFLLLAGGLVFLLKKPAKAFFETRKTDIAKGLEQGRKAEEDANIRMRDIEQRLSRMSSELTALRTQADSESAHERDNIIAEAKKDMERAVEQSRQEIDRIAQGIERDIKLKIADAVVDRASQTLATQMTQDDQKRVVIRFLKKA